MDDVRDKLRRQADTIDGICDELPQDEHKNEAHKAAEVLRGIAEDIDRALESMGIAKCLS